MGRNIIMAAKNNSITNLLNLSSSSFTPRQINRLKSIKGELEPKKNFLAEPRFNLQQGYVNTS